MQNFCLPRGLVALGMAAPASAADSGCTSLHQRRHRWCCDYDWSGFLIGANGGWGSSHKCFDITNFPVQLSCPPS